MGRRATVWVTWAWMGLQGCYLSHGLEGGPEHDAARLDGGRDIDAPLDAAPDVGRDTGADAGLDAASVSSCLTTGTVLLELCDPSCDPEADVLWYYTIAGCFPFPCAGECVEPPCDAPTTTLEECHRAHTHCAPELCRDTGGVWMPTFDECHHRVCGRAGPMDCEVGMPVCDCGPLGVFEEGLGCVPSDGCEPEAVRGEALCLATGGTWGATCCHARCGEPCEDDCAASACTCGASEIFDPVLGCTVSSECFERQLGESCRAAGQYCVAPLQCCEDCRGRSCTGDLRCMEFVCESGFHCGAGTEK